MNKDTMIKAILVTVMGLGLLALVWSCVGSPCSVEVVQDIGGCPK